MRTVWKQRIYNWLSWVKYKIFHAPLRLFVASDNKIKKPDLTVVFLHGISADSNTWRTTLKQFKKEKFLDNTRMIALDLLGFGRSPHPDWLDYSYEDYCKTIDRTLMKLKVKTPVVLVGHSMGALISAYYATNHESPFDIIRLVLVSPPVLMAAELARLPDKVYTKTYGNLHKIAEEISAAEVIAKLIQLVSSFRDYLKTQAFAKSMDNVILNRSNYQTFTKIRVPTLLLHGHFDPLVIGANLRRVAKNTPPYVRYQSVIGHHDISVGKRAKILVELKKALKDAKDAKNAAESAQTL